MFTVDVARVGRFPIERGPTSGTLAMWLAKKEIVRFLSEKHHFYYFLLKSIYATRPRILTITFLAKQIAS